MHVCTQPDMHIKSLKCHPVVGTSSCCGLLKRNRRQCSPGRYNAWRAWRPEFRAKCSYYGKPQGVSITAESPMDCESRWQSMMWWRFKQMQLRHLHKANLKSYVEMDECQERVGDRWSTFGMEEMKIYQINVLLSAWRPVIILLKYLCVCVVNLLSLSCNGWIIHSAGKRQHMRYAAMYMLFNYITKSV